MKLHAVLPLALLVLAVRAEVEQDYSHDVNGFSLKFIGKAPKFQFAPSGDNSSWVRVEFGSVYEQTESGQKVPVHSIESLAAAKPEYTTGELEQLSGLGQVSSMLAACSSSMIPLHDNYHQAV
jgi:hypothetical protein